MATAASAGEFEVLHTFYKYRFDPPPLQDGTLPWHFLLSDGQIYGTLLSGGGVDPAYGGIYRINTDGSDYTFLHNFSAGEGSMPNTLTLSGGTLYGATWQDTAYGSGGTGTLFRLDQDGSHFSVLHAFTGASGPKELTVSDGTIYGTSFNGGANNLGTAFRVGTDGGGFLQTHDFDVQAANAKGQLILNGGKLYGASEINGGLGLGSVYCMNLDGSGFTVLHGFGAGADGRSPEGGLVLIGSQLYGSTMLGGAYGQGLLFRINLDGSGYTVLHELTGAAGDTGCPEGTLQYFGGRLFGFNSNWHGSAAAYFSFFPDGSGYREEYSFAGSSVLPSSDFAVAADGIYGTTESFRVDTDLLFVVRGVPEPSALLFLASGCWLLHRRRFLRR